MSIEVALLLTGVFVAVLLFFIARLGSLRSEIRELESRDRRNSDLIQNLTRRVYVLEQAAAPHDTGVPEPPPSPAVAPLTSEIPVEVPAIISAAPAETPAEPAKHP